MPSFKISAALVATALFVGSRSQSVYQIDPNSVPLSTRQSWCTSQVNACPLLCTQLPGGSSTTQENDCDPTTLVFDCICGSGAIPNASEFSQTIPFFECQEFGNQCVAACNGVTACQSACRDDHPCGAQNPVRVNTTTTSSAATSTLPAGASSGTAGVVYTGLGGAAQTSAPASSAKKNGSQMALDMGRAYGLAVVMGGIFAGFALIM